MNNKIKIPEWLIQKYPSLKHDRILNMSAMMESNIGSSLSNTISTTDVKDYLEPAKLDYETIFKYLEEGKIDREKELIDMVGRLIMDRIDQLLDKDTDEIVKIFIENKIFKEENSKLWEKIHELENEISSLRSRVQFIEWNGSRFNERYREGETLHYEKSTNPNWGTSTTINNGSFTLTRTSGPVFEQAPRKVTEEEKKGLMDRIKDSLGIKKDTGSNQSKAL